MTTNTATKKSYADIQEKIQEENDKRLDRFSTYQKQRALAHKRNVPAPVYKDKDGLLKWANRKQRRKAMKGVKHAKNKEVQGRKGQSEDAQNEKAQEVKKEV